MKAISPVLATVIIIAITLIAAIAIAGFVFDLFGYVSPKPCATVPDVIRATYRSDYVPHNGTLPNGTSWLSWKYCTYHNIIILGHGLYPNGTQWWATKHD